MSPTKPLESILFRELSKANAKDIIQIVSPLLQELVNYSTNMFARAATSAGNEPENMAALLLYLHIIEMTDGVEVLVSQSCPVPAIPLLRSSFEALLAIEYILEDQYENRSLAWLAEYMRKRLSLYKSHDPSTPEGKKFQKILSKDKIVGNVTLSYPKEFDTFRSNYEQLLNSPQFQPVQSEFKKCKKENKGRTPNWYQLFGPMPSKSLKNLEQLATHLNRGGMYEKLYREWSSIHHAHDPTRFLTTTSKGTQAIRQLRDPSRIKEVATFAEVFINNATILILQKFRAGEEKSFSNWYQREVKGRLEAGE
jgi:hypothetical protein